MSEGREILCILGTRPEAIKLAPVVHALAARGLTVTICCTGQHRDLAPATLADFGLVPDVDLELMRPAQTPDGFLAAALPPLAATLAHARPALVVVQGDTSSTLAGALAASYARVPVAHVEAGLRSRAVEPFPEDLHRRLVTQTASLHFAPTAAAGAALLAEGVPAAAVAVTGNTVIDAVSLAATRLAGDDRLRAAVDRRLPPVGHRPLVVVTAHRRENHARMPAIAAAVAALARARDVDIVVPIHPHPAAGGVLRAALADVPGVTLVPPLDYFAFVTLLRRARFALTDSGGVQEEGPSLDCPVLVLRDTTERPEALATGAARLVGTDPRRILAAACRLIDDAAAHAAMATAAQPFGDGQAATRIAGIMADTLGRTRAGVAIPARQDGAALLATLAE
ncbi:MAG: UDP-N-acetylglucosamine 2-epimerase (non-hydrolyzing) [Sphingomonadaceae bacterium]|nr:UDP-N-acetylglucosamine 2-epimerase (non-hydrolyzing) [Sphingomonadaceae bacterium]